MFNIMFSEVMLSLLANRLRSFLTMLGMVIGVGAVILMLSIGEGAEGSINQMISSMGSNLLIVLSGTSTSGGVRMGTGAAPTLTISDSEAIADLPGVSGVTPFVNGAAQVIYENNNWATLISGVNPSFFYIQNWSLSSGIFFTSADLRSANRVAVVGQTVAKNLFGDSDPTGKIIRIQKSPYLIIGTLNPKGQSLDGRDQDDVIYIPVTTAQRKLFGSRFSGSVRVVIVQALSPDALSKLTIPITNLLRERHHIAKNMEDDFTIQNLTAIVNTALKAARILSLMLGAIASISLVVGGIGIMNIMLVSVTERTREIGIRAALGARRRLILLQFLIEAVSLSLIGCIVGVLLGIASAYLVFNIFDINMIISFRSILMAFLIAGGIGIFFGYYPAHKASYLKPIEALRYQ